MKIGVLYLSHAMLVLAELIVYSTKGLHASQLSGFSLLWRAFLWHMEVRKLLVLSEPTHILEDEMPA